MVEDATRCHQKDMLSPQGAPNTQTVSSFKGTPTNPAALRNAKTNRPKGGRRKFQIERQRQDSVAVKDNEGYGDSSALRAGPVDQTPVSPFWRVNRGYEGTSLVSADICHRGLGKARPLAWKRFQGGRESRRARP